MTHTSRLANRFLFILLFSSLIPLQLWADRFSRRPCPGKGCGLPDMPHRPPPPAGQQRIFQPHRPPPRSVRVLVGRLWNFHFPHFYCLTQKMRILSVFVSKSLYFITKSSENSIIKGGKSVETAWKWQPVAERRLIPSFYAKSSLKPAYFAGEKPADRFINCCPPVQRCPKWF